MRLSRHPGRPATVLVALLALVVPASAAAHSAGVGAGDEPVDEVAAAELGAVQSRALAELPRETAWQTCRDTDYVEGIGDACRTRDGVFRVRLATGLTITTHGGDAPRDPDARAAAAPHLPESEAAIDGASVADIECVTAPGDRRVELVYARPADKSDRSASIAAPMRQALYEASAFVDAESRALDDAQGRRIPVLCSGGEPVVHAVTVRASGSSGGDYDDIVDDLVAQGFPAPTSNTTSTRRFMVFYDDQNTVGAAGVGAIWLDDEAGIDNYNNLGARYAVEFDWSVSRAPHWDVFLHEMSHNMGAVADSAPDASQAGHCIDGLDIMCYDDGGGGGSYSSGACPVERFDCGGDTYFNPSPAPGSWLATHWNLGSSDNVWLVPRDTGWDDGGVPDTSAPTVPASVTATAISGSVIAVAWSASTDDRSSVRYRVEADRLDGGAWLEHATMTHVSTTSTQFEGLVAGSTYRFRVFATDLAENTSAATVAQATTLTAPPVGPASAGLAIVDPNTADAAWVAGTSTVGIRGHEVELQRGVEPWVRIGEVAGTTTRLTGLASGADYRIRVRAVANDGATTGWRSSAYVTMPGELAGATGAIGTPAVSVATTAPTRATASWTATPGAASWDVTLTDARGAARTFQASATSATLADLVPGAEYVLAVVARSADGETASAPGTARFRMPRDTVAPSASRFGRARFVGTTMRISWRAATDASGIRSYQLQRRAGKRWIAVAVRRGATSASVTRVRRGSSTVLRVRAIDAAGNAGRWTTTRIRRR